MKSSIVYFAIFFASISFSYSQFCISANDGGAISPNSTYQTVTAVAGEAKYWTFSAVAGTTYSFSTCNNVYQDTYLRIYNSSYVLTSSLDDGGPFCSNVLSSTNWTASISGTYYIHLARYSCGLLDRNVTMGYSTVSSSVPTLATPPSSSSYSLTVTGITNTSATISWINGTGTARLGVLAVGNFDSGNSNGINYIANTVYGSGNMVGNGYAVVNNGTSTSVTITNLSPGTNYGFSLLEYNGTGSTINYTNSSSSGYTNFATTGVAVTPSVSASNLQFSTITDNSANVSWTNGNGSRRVVVAYASTSPSGVPADGIGYYSSSYGNGSSLSTGFVVYEGTSNGFTLSNLGSGTSYYLKVYEYNGSFSSSVYKNTTPASNNFTTNS